MPQKRNPVAAVAVDASVRRAIALVPQLFAAMAGEHERAAGAWQSAWAALSDLFGAAGAALAHLGDSLEGLVVHPEAMRANIERVGGLVMAEAARVALQAAGAEHARGLVQACARVRSGAGHPARGVARGPGGVGELGEAGLEAALDPSGYLGMRRVRRPRAGPLGRRRGHVAMARLPLVDPERTSGAAREALDRLERERGFVPGLYRLMANAPRLMPEFVHLTGAMRGETALPARLKEAAVLAVAAETACATMRAAHLAPARAAGLSELELAAIEDGSMGELAADIGAVVAYAREVTRSGRANRASWAAVERELDDEQLAELALVVAFYNMVARFIEPLELEVDTRYTDSNPAV